MSEAEIATAAGVHFQDVTKVFDGGTAGVYEITLRVPWGTLYVVLGANGAGKTTLLNLCLGHLTPDRGSVSIAGTVVRGNSDFSKRRLAYVPEISRVYPDLSAIENIRFFLKLSDQQATDAQITESLVRLRFPLPAATGPARTFSKGMRQKVVIAIGLLKRADVFLFDEPTSGLDPLSVRSLIGIIDELRQEGKAIFASSHDLPLTRTADRFGVLRAGRLFHEASGNEAAQAIDLFSDNHH